jgi:signal transduction histidine kinase
VVATTLADVLPEALELTTSLDPAPLSGDRRLIERLAANLLDNAIRHNVPDGWVRATTRTTGGRATLTVSNSGPLIAPGEESELLEPFRRAAPERSSHGNGHGLGLSITAAIAAAHDAELTMRARPQGGLDVEVRFQAAPATPGQPALERTSAV